MTTGFTAATPRPAKVLFDDGSTVELSGDQTELVDLVLGGPDTVTPETAARMLGVSRPMVLRWIREGHLEDHMQGTRHHITLTSVKRYGEARAAAGRRAAATIAAAAGGDERAAGRLVGARQRAKQRIAERDG